jgi:signal transduction histidine kinase
MSPTFAVLGWVLAVAAAVAALGARLLLGSRAEQVARACHELRGPLTAARLGLECGLRVGGLPPSRLRAIELELGRATLALADLGASDRGAWPRKRQIRSFSRPSCRRGDGLSGVERFDVRGLLEDSVEAWRAVASSLGLELAVSWSGGPAEVLGDRLRLAQATGNLIANAIEHGGGEIQVRGSADRSVVRIEVADQGPGLRALPAELGRRARGRWTPPRHRARGRWTPSRSRVRSRGHGLAIAAAVAAAHGGLLSSAPSERGARLVLELPLASEHATAAI